MPPSPDSRAPVRPATRDDRDLLVRLMGEFYAETDFPFDAERAGAAFDRLLADPRLGRAWILEDDDDAAGYFVMTLSFSMEHGGPSAWLDDLYVRPASRRRGFGRAAMGALRAACESLGVRTVQLEVGGDNAAALALYREAGFVPRRLERLVLDLGRGH